MNETISSPNLPGIAEIKAANASVNDNGYILLTVTRPVGSYLAWVWLRLGMTPRQVTYLTILLAIALLLIAAFGGADGAVTATILCFIWQALDVSDGSMARALGRRDNFGGFVDYSSGMLIVAFLPLCLGIGLARIPDAGLLYVLGIFDLSGSAAVILPLALGGFISVTAFYTRLLNRVLQIRFQDSLSDDDNSSGAAGALVRNIVKNLETIGGLHLVIFFVFALTEWLSVALVLYSLFYSVFFVSFVIAVYFRFKEIRSYL